MNNGLKSLYRTPVSSTYTQTRHLSKRMLRSSVFIIFTIFSTSNQVKIWDEEELPDTTTDSFDVSNMAQLPLIDPTVNKSLEYDLVDCGEVFDFVQQGNAVGFEFDHLSGVWNSYGDAKKCIISFLVPARNSIKMFCEDFDIPADDGFCVFNPRGLFEGLTGGSKECYFGNKRKVMIPFPYTDEMTTITITFIPQSWEMYDGQGAR